MVSFLEPYNAAIIISQISEFRVCHSLENVSVSSFTTFGFSFFRSLLFYDAIFLQVSISSLCDPLPFSIIAATWVSLAASTDFFSSGSVTSLVSLGSLFRLTPTLLFHSGPYRTLIFWWIFLDELTKLHDLVTHCDKNSPRLVWRQGFLLGAFDHGGGGVESTFF